MSPRATVAVPSDAVQGFVAAGFEAVAEEFRRNLTERGDSGAAFAAFAGGRLVVDLWGGLAAPERPRAWERNTIAAIFSGTKGLLATGLLVLVERGSLELDQPVCVYWPEFAAQGKSDVLVRHLVSHQAGLPGITTAVSAREATDASRMAQLLASQATIHRPGSRFYYHALTFGWLCGELIRRVDGRGAGRFFAEEVAGPLGLDAWIGLPEEQEGRVATMRSDAGFGSRKPGQEGSQTDPVAWSIWENPRRFEAGSLAVNARFWRAAEVPASNGIASARAIARLYGCLARGGEIDGTRLLLPATLELGRQRLTQDVEPYLQKPMAFGVGFELQTVRQPFGPATTAFGHSGAGGSVHGAWPDLQTGFSYLTNTLRELPHADPRSDSLLRSLYRAATSASR
jgi:CubicO group peptidase (beta-lactamase class C family)